MFQKIKEKILTYCVYPEDKLNEKTELINDLHISSLDIMLLIGDLEDEFNIQFNQDDIIDTVTVGDLVDLIQKKIENSKQL